MQLITCGDNDAFNILYNRYKNRLLYYFFRMLWNSQELAQDFLQEIFYKIIEKPHLFNPRQNFKKWIFSVANNMCKNEYRKKEVRRNTSILDSVDIYSDINEETKNIEKIIPKIFEILDEFTDEQKSCFLFRYREGFSVKEISEILNISEGTVKSRLFYTRKKIELEMHEKYPNIIKEFFYE